MMIPYAKCKKCNKTWQMRVPDPVECPRCKKLNPEIEIITKADANNNITNIEQTNNKERGRFIPPAL